MEHNIDEINKLEQQILETQNLLNKKGSQNENISSLKTQRNIFGLLALLFLIAIAVLLYYRNKTGANQLMNDKNVTLINNDSLNIYKQGYFNFLNSPNTKITDSSSSLNDEKIIYNVQIGAFKDFQLTSDGLMNLSEFQDNGYNKFSLGNYKTYAEAKILKDSLIKLGFKDCFLTAKSFGNPINIREALALSNEPEFLEQ